MKDRVPIKPNRFAVFDENHNFLRYEYHERADEPTEPGTAINKASLLSDTTAQTLGLTSTATVDNALLHIAELKNRIPDNLADQLGLPRGNSSGMDDALLAAGSVVFRDFYTYKGVNKSVPTALSAARSGPNGIGIGNYALFAGSMSNQIKTVDTYNTSLVRGTAPELSAIQGYPAVASNGAYGLFAGGYDFSPGNYTSTVTAYNTALVRGSLVHLTTSCYQSSGTRAGNYAIFAGGRYGNGHYVYVDAYNTSLVHSTPAQLTVARASSNAASVGNYALFDGGTDVSYQIEVYSSSLVKQTPLTQSITRYNCGHSSAMIGNYALFAGGSTPSTTVDAFNNSLIKTTVSLSRAEHVLYGGQIKSYGIFARTDGYATDIFNTSLVRSSAPALFKDNSGFVSASVGNYAVFAGAGSSTANAISEGTSASFTIPAFSSFKFDGHHSQEQVTLVNKSWSNDGKLSGYIKRSFVLSGQY